MNYEQAWKELQMLIETMREFDLEGEEAETVILCIDHIQSQIIEEKEEITV